MTESYRQRLLTYANTNEPFLANNAIRVLSIEDGRVVAELQQERHVMNCWGLPHGGALFTMADVSCGLAAISLREEALVTLNASIDYLDGATPDGAVRCEARVERMGGKVAFCVAELHDALGRHVATVRAAMYFTGRPLPEQFA